MNIDSIPSPASPAEAPEHAASTLPSYPTRLIGRERDVAALAELLAAGGPRLITLTGPGGVGKTRLAVHVAAQAAGSFTDGVRFVRLAAVADGALVMGAIADELDVRETGPAPIERLVARRLRERRILLVLDNLEQITGCAPVVAELLAAVPTLRILATSREALRVYGEQEYGVEPLALDGEQHESSSSTLSPAVALFVERARATSRTFMLDEGNRAAVVEICARLDGLPLAIELAASRIKLLPPRAILARLEHRLHVLTGGALDLPERQRTLRSAIDWSYDLLEANEQRLFRRMAVFGGGCTLEAAEAVCLLPGEPPFDVLEAMASLVNKCLVRQSGNDEHPRFTMLSTIAEYAAERLDESNETAAVRDAHVAWCREVIEVQAAEHVLGQNQFEWMRIIASELDNMRLALRRMLEQKDALGMLSLSVGLSKHWSNHGSPSEGREWLKAAIALAGQHATAMDSEVYAWALLNAGMLAYLQAEYGEGIALSVNARERFEKLGNRRGASYSLANLGLIHRASGAFDEAIPLLDEALAGFIAAGDEWGEGLCYQYRATYFLMLDMPGALDSARRAVAIFEKLQDNLQLVYSRGILAHVHLWQGSHDEADVLLRDVFAMARLWNDQRGLGRTYRMRADIAAARKQYREALGLYRESLRILWEREERWHIVGCIEGIAALVAETGRPELGAQLLGIAGAERATARDGLMAPHTEAHAQMLARVRGTLDPAALEAALAAGAAMSLDDAWRIVNELPADIAAAGGEACAEPLPEGLTRRELEILRGIAEGLTDAQVAERLFISPRTVNAHLRSIYAKIGVANRSGATRYAIGKGLVDGGS